MYPDAANRVIIAARKHRSNDSSRIALQDAIELYDDGDYEHAYGRALDSLAHSVGLFHPDYKKFAERRPS